jgi:hypothetical protein
MEIGLGAALTPRAHSFPFSLAIPFLKNPDRRKAARVEDAKGKS